MSVLFSESKYFNVGMHLDVYESIYIKHGMMIDII